MRTTCRTLLAASLVSAAALALPADAPAQDLFSREFKPKEAGDFMIRGRVIGVLPDESSDVETIGGDVSVDNAVTPELDFSYFFTDNIAVELIAATANHEVELHDSAAGDLDLGDVWLLPPTLTAQYHFLPQSRFSPYVGAGVNYTLFYGADAGDADDINYDNGFGPALQFGFDFAISGPWSLNVDVKRIWLNTEAEVDALGTTVDADVDIDPWIVGAGIAYRF
jgi:outer membrane protein